MPVVHEYRNKRGMYVKARHGNSMVTYQLAPAAVAELHRRGKGEGSKLTPDVLHGWVAAGLAYTHGSGAGVMDAPPPPSPNGTVTVSVTPSLSVGEPAKPRKQKRKKPKQQPGGRLYPPSCYGDTRPAPPPPSRPYTPPVRLPPSPPPALPAASASSGGRLFPASCYADYQDTSPAGQAPAARPAASPARPALAPPSPLTAAPSPPDVKAEPFDWWRVVGHLWAAIIYEFAGIPVWLWLLMLIGVLVPGVLIARVVGRR